MHHIDTVCKGHLTKRRIIHPFITLIYPVCVFSCFLLLVSLHFPISRVSEAWGVTRALLSWERNKHILLLKKTTPLLLLHAASPLIYMQVNWWRASFQCNTLARFHISQVWKRKACLMGKYINVSGSTRKHTKTESPSVITIPHRERAPDSTSKLSGWQWLMMNTQMKSKETGIQTPH